MGLHILVVPANQETEAGKNFKPRSSGLTWATCLKEKKKLKNRKENISKKLKWPNKLFSSLEARTPSCDINSVNWRLLYAFESRFESGFNVSRTEIL